MNRRAVLANLALTALTASGPGARAAERYPNRPIRIIIPFEPGGPSDVIVRSIAPIMTQQLGQPIVAENRSGAGGNIGSAYVARAENDGYTLLAGGSPTVISPHFVRGLTFDTQRDLTAVTPLCSGPYYIVVGSGLPVRSVQDLIEMAKKNPGAVTYASSGIGNRPHVAGAQFARLTGTRMTHVPYKGTAPATNDLLAGRVTFMFVGMTTVRGHIQSGRLRALAVCTPERDPDIPDVPTLAEAGVPNYYPNIWYGLLGPAGMDDTAKHIIAGAVATALRSPDVIRQFESLGTPPVILDPAKFQAFYDAEIRQWRDFFQANPDILTEQS